MKEIKETSSKLLDEVKKVGSVVTELGSSARKDAKEALANLLKETKKDREDVVARLDDAISKLGSLEKSWSEILDRRIKAAVDDIKHYIDSTTRSPNVEAHFQHPPQFHYQSPYYTPQAFHSSFPHSVGPRPHSGPFQSGFDPRQHYPIEVEDPNPQYLGGSTAVVDSMVESRPRKRIRDETFVDQTTPLKVPRTKESLPVTSPLATIPTPILKAKGATAKEKLASKERRAEKTKEIPAEKPAEKPTEKTKTKAKAKSSSGLSSEVSAEFMAEMIAKATQAAFAAQATMAKRHTREEDSESDDEDSE